MNKVDEFFDFEVELVELLDRHNISIATTFDNHTKRVNIVFWGENLAKATNLDRLSVKSLSEI